MVKGKVNKRENGKNGLILKCLTNRVVYINIGIWIIALGVLCDITAIFLTKRISIKNVFRMREPAGFSRQRVKGCCQRLRSKLFASIWNR